MTRVDQWVSAPLPPEVRDAIVRLERSDGITRLAVMPDVHLSRDVCVGLVVASPDRLYPQAVGGDIGCGMSAVRLQGEAALLDEEETAGRVMVALDRLVPRNRHRAATLRERLPDPLDGVALSDPRLDRERTRDGRVQFATLGRGNHFLEFQRDDDGALWLTVHSGSRAMGQAVTQHHLAQSESDSIGLRFLRAESPAGRSYLADADWCVAYAEASRLAMLDAVCKWLAANLGIVADVASGIRCHHNFARRETHDGEELWVHRKGALSAEEGELGIIPGSMGAPTFHVEGRGCERSLRSSSHGAGRALPRSEARRRISRRALRDSMKGVWYDPRLEARLIDEAPAAYKDIRKVMKAQRELTRIVRRLKPVLVYKGG